MKKIPFILLLLLSLACSKNDEPSVESDVIKITSTAPEFVRIGEIVTFSGNNLDRITDFKVGNKFGEIIDASEKEIKVSIPTVYKTSFSLKAYNGFIEVESIPLNLIGTYPEENDFTNYDIHKLQLVDETRAYCMTNNNIYKSSNGGKNWVLQYSTNLNITSIYFVNKEVGWFGTMDGKLFKTIDGGNTFTEIFQSIVDYMSRPIMDIKFKNINDGYILNSKGDIYKTENGIDFQQIYDYPNEKYGNAIEFWNLDLKDDFLIANSEYALVVKKPGSPNFQILEFEKSVWDIQIVNSNVIYLSTYWDDSLRLLKSNDFGNNWEVTSNTRIQKFYFVNENKGIGFAPNEGYDYHIVYETNDGGKSWNNQFKFNDFEFGSAIDFYGNSGMISGMGGKLWHHILP
ncbi:WD40/YVTN/BNR-like repeat-containing protein [Christiangramia sp. ASW11-125]|uniref:WD40/YVTN/BNR-like repeat-containing protein n=1 Tax=Christiangramia sp. ASW11-125 TaxID=3400701 RepID=UPI003AAF48AA